MGLRRTSDIGTNTRFMIEKMNEVGIGKIVKFVKETYPRQDVHNCIAIIRLAAKYGYVGTACKINTSKQYVEQVVKKYYGYALEVENNVQ